MLDHDLPKKTVLGVLNDQLKRQAAKCIGFVPMPDHVHAILWFPETGQLSRFMHGWKRRSSYEVRKRYSMTFDQYLSALLPTERFWQLKYYSFEIYSERKIQEKLTYMHLNPVRAGLVNKAVDWKWSSA